ncbi:MAG: hypothetical protein QM730_24700 [Anaerolineales bacterium]
MAYDPSDPTAKESALQPSEQRRLEEANAFMENNKPAQAAPIFAKLAEVLRSSGQPKRAANLHAQAALAFARSRNESALMQARAALTLLLQYKLDQQASAFYSELSRELNKRGMMSAAEALTKEFGDKVPQPIPLNSRAAQWNRLPSNCPNCGAALRQSDVRWTDANTIECGFCGTPIRPSMG